MDKSSFLKDDKWGKWGFIVKKTLSVYATWFQVFLYICLLPSFRTSFFLRDHLYSHQNFTEVYNERKICGSWKSPSSTVLKMDEDLNILSFSWCGSVKGSVENKLKIIPWRSWLLLWWITRISFMYTQSPSKLISLFFYSAKILNKLYSSKNHPEKSYYYFYHGWYYSSPKAYVLYTSDLNWTNALRLHFYFSLRSLQKCFAWADVNLPDTRNPI